MNHPLSSLPPASPLPAQPGRAFFGAVGLMVVWSILLFLILAWGFRGYAAIERMQHITYYEDGYQHLTVKLTEPAFHSWQLALWAAWGLTTAAGLLAYQRKGAFVKELAALGRELWQGGKALIDGIKQLPRHQQWLALGLLLLILAGRTYFLLTFPLEGDEAQSYLSFGSQGLAAATSYYPLPNNHILLSSIDTLFYGLNHGVFWTMRAPAYLISLGGTILLFATLLRFVNFTVAFLTIGLFCATFYGQYSSFVGRGYFLQAVCAGLGFMSILGISRRLTRQRLYWFVFIMTSLIGGYAIPTYAYAFLSIVAALGGMAVVTRQPGAIGAVLGATLLVSVASLLLYAPVLLVSGPAQLLGNRYVASIPLPVFWTGFTGYFGPLQSDLVGQERLGLAAMVTVYVGILAGAMWARRGSSLRQYGVFLLLMLLMPYALIALQQVYPPTRTLMYLLVYVFMGAGLLYVAVGQYLGIPSRWLTYLAGGLVVSYFAYQFRYTQQISRSHAATQQQVAATYAWLEAKQPARVYVEPLHYQFFLYFLGQQHKATGQLASSYQPNIQFNYLVLARHDSRITPSGNWTTVWQNAEVRIVAPSGQAR